MATAQPASAVSIERLRADDISSLGSAAAVIDAREQGRRDFSPFGVPFFWWCSDSIFVFLVWIIAEVANAAFGRERSHAKAIVNDESRIEAIRSAVNWAPHGQCASVMITRDGTGPTPARLKRLGEVFVLHFARPNLPQTLFVAAADVAVIDKHPSSVQWSTDAVLKWGDHYWPISLEASDLAYIDRATTPEGELGSVSNS